jgi:hypothetical protein
LVFVFLDFSLLLLVFVLVVSCVVKTDCTLGSYGFGSKGKLELLDREKRGFSSKKESKVDDGRSTVFPVENVLRKLCVR